MPRDTFTHSPLEYLQAENLEEAASDLTSYFDSFTGSRFEHLADSDTPNSITARDIVAVSTLGVDVPAHVSIWILEEGAPAVSRELRAIPVDQDIWDPSADLGPSGPANRLWDLLRGAHWADQHGGMGDTKTSKLLATKRPRLIPINDSRTEALLYPGEPTDTWLAWRREFQANGGDLALVIDHLRRHEPRSEQLSALRVLDVVLWFQARRRDLPPRR